MDYIEVKKKKILVIGKLFNHGSSFNAIIKQYGFKPKDFELVSYSETTNYNFKALLRTNKYSDIFIGQVPHSAKNIKSASSPSQFLIEHQSILPKVDVLTTRAGGLKISRASLEHAIINSVKFKETTINEFELGLIA